MDTRTGELWSPSDVDSAREKVARGALDELTGSERRFILAQADGAVAWITPEIARRVRDGEEAALQREIDQLREQFERACTHLADTTGEGGTDG